MKTILTSIFVASLAVLTGCVDSGGYRGDPGFRSGGYSGNDRWRNDRDDRWRDNRDNGRERYRERPGRPDESRDRPEWRNGDRRENNDNRGDHGRYDFQGRDTWQQSRPIIRPSH